MKLQSGTVIPRVRDIMQRKIISVSVDTRLDELAHLLTERVISGAPVVDSEGNVVGVVSLADIVAHDAHPQSEIEPYKSQTAYYRDLWMEEELADGFSIEDYGSSMQVQDIMTPVVHQVHEDDSLQEVVSLMLQARIHRALVTDGDTIVGIVTTMDLIKTIPRLLDSIPKQDAVGARG